MRSLRFLQLCVLVLPAFPASLLATTKTDGEQQCTLVQNCVEKAANASKSCYYFLNLVDEKCGTVSSYCDKYKQNLIKDCTAGFCKECLKKTDAAYDDCLKFYQTAIPNSSQKSKQVCATMRKDLRQKCPGVCQDLLGLTKSNPGKNCKAIIEANSHAPSGLYWIKPDGDATAVQGYCDMSFQGGGWTLASYGYVATTAYGVQNKNNKNIPNMNHPNGFNWHPTTRNSSNGLISLEHGAVNVARGASTMIMAAGNNPASGGINDYSYVYSIDISQNPYKITFANHNRYNGAIGTKTIPKMHVVEFTVKALKGESGSAKRYALGEALGISWSDSYPTGYGFSPVNAQYGTWNKGPFFPSVHSGDKKGGCKSTQSFAPDVQNGCPNYVHNGWHTLNTMQKLGQTSIWFK